MALSPNPVVRTFIFVFGILSLVLGIIGIFLPLLPTAPFILLSAACFARSSSRFHDWLMRQSRIGPLVHRWHERGAIPRLGKFLAIGGILSSIWMIWSRPLPMIVQIVVTPILLGVVVFVVTRPHE